MSLRVLGNIAWYSLPILWCFSNCFSVRVRIQSMAMWPLIPWPFGRNALCCAL
jgi:hypothetical protein